MAYRNKNNEARENLCLRVNPDIIKQIKEISNQRFIGTSKIVEICLTTSMTLDELKKLPV